ncbi:hypothetical protein PC9H_007105 [Pleurotus ostreatus]|uniref:MYND-type domain-containing protein n=1 Tax=Pleurotus ostreatus TaxID=5322 RepID=A0A8H6ZUS7_PLEOS|nr:uncharacterized protein PC9H_007105 [Pleurotus ostreatus]KAF7427888.1 hypothetical protein PC9H_007105 [Pleurotus ostreatus]
MHLKPERTPTEATVPNRLTPVAEMAFLALMGIVKAAHLLHDPSPHSDAIIRAWPGVFKWSVFFFSVDIQRPGVEQDAKFFMQDLIAATWFTFTRVDRIAAIMAETPGAIELMTELFFLEGSIPQMSIVNHPNAAATLDSMLHEAEDVWGTLDRVVATANGDAERIARVALSRLRTAVNGPGFETPIGGAALNLMCRLCRRRGHPLLYAFLHHNAIATVTKVAASAARSYMKTGNDGVIPALVGSFGFVANCLESTDGFTWVTIAMQSGLIQAFLEVSILLPTLPVECDRDMILAIFKVILPRYLIYRSVIQAVDGAMQKVESNPASKWVSQTPAKDVWHNFKRVAFERRALVANLTDTKHKAITSCDNSKCQKADFRSNFRKCSSCYTSLYCSKECQTIAWKEGGHKITCKLKVQERLGKNQSVSKNDIAFFHSATIRDISYNVPLYKELAEKEYPDTPMTKLVACIDYDRPEPRYFLQPLAGFENKQPSLGSSNNAVARNEALIERVQTNEGRYSLFQSSIAYGETSRLVLSMVNGEFWKMEPQMLDGIWGETWKEDEEEGPELDITTARVIFNEYLRRSEDEGAQ